VPAVVSLIEQNLCFRVLDGLTSERIETTEPATVITAYFE
jgi:hypothetical protein